MLRIRRPQITISLALFLDAAYTPIVRQTDGKLSNLNTLHTPDNHRQAMMHHSDGLALAQVNSAPSLSSSRSVGMRTRRALLPPWELLADDLKKGKV